VRRGSELRANPRMDNLSCGDLQRRGISTAEAKAEKGLRREGGREVGQKDTVTRSSAQEWEG
jgi:hypothetical protein